MGSSVDRAIALKKRIDALRSQRDRAEGVVGKLLADLKSEFDCGCLEEARKLLESLRKKQSARKANLDKLVTAFLEQYEDKLPA